MSSIKTFNEFFLEKSLQASKLELLNIIKEKSKDLSEVIVIDTIIESNLVDKFYQEGIDLLNEESFKDRLAKKVNSIKNTIKDKGKKALSDAQEKIIKIGTNVKSYVTNIIKIITKKIGDLITLIKGATSKAVKSSKKIKEKIAENKDKKEFVGELGNFKQMYSAGIKWVKSGFVKDLSKAVNTKATNETLELHVYDTLIECFKSGELTLEELLLEEEGKAKIPFLSKLVDGIRKIPPMKQLFQFGEYAEKVATNALHKCSVFLKKAAGAGGPFQFPMLGVIVGIGLEELARAPIKMGLIAAIPALGLIVTVIETLETATTIMSLAA